MRPVIARSARALRSAQQWTVAQLALGALAALRTGISAVGPLVAGALLAFDLPHVFVLAHVVINAVAIVLALRLFRTQTVAATSSPTPSQVRVDVDTVDEGASGHSGSRDAEPVPAL